MPYAFIISISLTCLGAKRFNVDARRSAVSTLAEVGKGYAPRRSEALHDIVVVRPARGGRVSCCPAGRAQTNDVAKRGSRPASRWGPWPAGGKRIDDAARPLTTRRRGADIETAPIEAHDRPPNDAALSSRLHGDLSRS